MSTFHIVLGTRGQHHSRDVDCGHGLARPARRPALEEPQPRHLRAADRLGADRAPIRPARQVRDRAAPQGKGAKDRYAPFPTAFKETLALHIDAQRPKHAQHLFESSRKKHYSTRGVRSMLARYAKQAGLAHNMPPHRLRHFLFTWLKTQGIDDALIQPYSGHATRESLEPIAREASERLGRAIASV